MSRSSLAMAALATALVTPVATASDYGDADVRTTVVSVADLDLSTGWGMDRLIKRLRGRIDDMCGGDEDCRDEAWLSADWQVARDVSRDQWRRRIAEERESDRRFYRMRRFAPPPMPRPEPVAPPPPPLPRIAYIAPPATLGRLVSKTTTTTTTTIKTTMITLTYRTPSGTYRAPPRPRCACVE